MPSGPGRYEGWRECLCEQTHVWQGCELGKRQREPRGGVSLPEIVQHPEMPFPCLQGPAGLDGLDGKDGKPGLRVRWECVGGGRSPILLLIKCAEKSPFHQGTQDSS